MKTARISPTTRPPATVPAPGREGNAGNLLRQAGVRVTDARLNVLSELLLSQRALSHLEIQDAMPAMDRVTLYRALDCLTDAGLAHKISGDDRVFRYSTGNDAVHAHGQHQRQVQHQHGHFKCTRCSRVFCLDEAQAPASLRTQLQASLQSTLGPGFQSHDVELTIKGWCADCAK
ncbi:Fur family transcriptional regulator [Undibacterium sp. Di26W]|uniref:Fur family transcriptional regulator n=1 Tax=Undibacterium sp. Di26W TaxID=3413035 RepID=UPI003BF3E098